MLRKSWRGDKRNIKTNTVKITRRRRQRHKRDWIAVNGAIDFEWIDAAEKGCSKYV